MCSPCPAHLAALRDGYRLLSVSTGLTVAAAIGIVGGAHEVPSLVRWPAGMAALIAATAAAVRSTAVFNDFAAADCVLCSRCLNNTGGVHE